MSGNGTRLQQLFRSMKATAKIRLMTGAGAKDLRLLDRNGRWFLFEIEHGGAVDRAA